MSTPQDSGATPTPSAPAAGSTRHRRGRTTSHTAPASAVDPAPDPQEALDRLEGATGSHRVGAPEPDRYALASRRLIYVGIVVGAVVIVVAGLVCGYTIVETRQNTADIDAIERIASGEASGAVGANRLSAARDVRGTPDQDCAAGDAASVTLECANRELAALGAPAVVDPGPATAPSQLAALVGEARAYARFVAATREGGPGAGVGSGSSGPFR